MKSCGEKRYPILVHAVDESVLTRQTPRDHARLSSYFRGSGFPKPSNGFRDRILDKRQNAQNNLSVMRGPMLQILPELGFEDRRSVGFPGQGRHSAAIVRLQRRQAGARRWLNRAPEALRVGRGPGQVGSFEDTRQFVGRNQCDISALASADNEHFIIRVRPCEYGREIPGDCCSCVERQKGVVQRFRT